MTKQLYEEALADVKRVKEVAQSAAERAVLEAVTPRIREFIDEALLAEWIEVDNPEATSPGGPAKPAANVGTVPPAGNGPGVAAPKPAPAAPGAPAPAGAILTDTGVPPTGLDGAPAAGAAAAISPPGPDGKVTLDIDALCSSEPGTPVPPPMFGAPSSEGHAEPDGDEVIVVGGGAEGELPPGEPDGDEAEYEISLESVTALQPVVKAARRSVLSLKDFKVAVTKISEQINLFQRASGTVRSTKAFNEQIAQTISRVEDMYDYVQERIADPAEKSTYETMLEASFEGLNKLQESTTMSQKTNKGKMNEADVTLKLTGLPDDIDLDTVGVDLVSDEDEEGMQGGQDQLGGQDLGGMGGEQGEQMESRNRLSDDTIVEIDEKMLRREIARMRAGRVNEEHTGKGGSETKQQSWGNGPGGANILDDFGGGDDEGDAHDQDIVDLSPAKASKPLGEADGEDLEEQDDLDEQDDQDDLDEGQDDLDEADALDQWNTGGLSQDAMPSSPPPAASAPPPSMDELDQMAQAVDPNGMGGNNHQPTNKQARTPGDSFAVTRQEGLRRLAFEKKLQERIQARGAALKKEAAKARQKKNAKRFNEVKSEYALATKRFNESVARTKKVQLLVVKATKKLQEQRSNSAAARPAENKADDSLRKKLAETNLYNAKLLFTNRLLQNEQLTSRQKAQVIKQLEQAKTIREARLVFDSLTSTLAGSSKPVNEGAQGRQVLGSASKPSRPGSTATTVNEGYEAERWAQLAGITKR